MSFILQPWQFFVVIFVGWVQREQQKIIDFYQTQLDAAMKAQGKKRLLLTDDQRRLLAVKGKSLGRKALMELTTIVTPDTILRWHRELVHDRRQRTQAARHRTSPRPKAANDLGNLSESALGGSGGGRLYDHRGLDERRTGHLLLTLRHGVEDSPRSLRRLHDESQRIMDEADRPRADEL
jgi:hypothetical protein